MHVTRKKISKACPACAAGPFQPCIIKAEPARDPRSASLNEDILRTADEQAWCEFEILVATRRLRELNRDHPYVKALVKAINEKEESDKAAS